MFCDGFAFPEFRTFDSTNICGLTDGLTHHHGIAPNVSLTKEMEVIPCVPSPEAAGLDS